MNKTQTQKNSSLHTLNPGMPVIANIVKSDSPDKIMIQHNNDEPKPARLISSMDRFTLMQEQSQGRQVLVIFENGDPDLPVIIGLMESLVENILEMEKPREPVQVTIDKKKHLIEAEEEITLKCGNASITLNKHGKIVIKGAELISRASGTNKIKGSNIQLN